FSIESRIFVILSSSPPAVIIPKVNGISLSMVLPLEILHVLRRSKPPHSLYWKYLDFLLLGNSFVVYRAYIEFVVSPNVLTHHLASKSHIITTISPIVNTDGSNITNTALLS